VSYLNTRPLVEGLDDLEGIELIYDVPARLPDLLNRRLVDVALVPVIDLLRSGDAWEIVSDACIGCQGETLTVRVFSRLAPDRISHLHVDGESHTSVALAQVVWLERYGCRLRISRFERQRADNCQAVLLIGDKVVAQRLEGFSHETDLGAAWHELTGLPFVFAAWARPRGSEVPGLARLLSEARDRGEARAAAIAEQYGPDKGWPVDLAVRYLTEHLGYRLTARHREGMELFFELARRCGIPPATAELVSP
jgi:chorismate dehydratase